MMFITKAAAAIAGFIARWPQYRKALGAFVGSLIAGLVAVLALGVLSGVQAGYVAAAIAFLSPIGGWLGAFKAKPNAPTS